MMIQKALIPDALPDPPKREMIEINFTVFGEQRPQGSKISQVIYRKDGTPVLTKTGRVLSIVRDDNKHTKSWRNGVADAARQAYSGPLLIGAVYLEITFYAPRPQGHFGSGRNAGSVRGSAPKHKITKPDTVKLTRAIEDALSGVLWKDDSQVVDHRLSKKFGDCYRTEITIVSLDGLTEEPF